MTESNASAVLLRHDASLTVKLLSPAVGRAAIATLEVLDGWKAAPLRLRLPLLAHELRQYAKAFEAMAAELEQLTEHVSPSE